MSILLLCFYFKVLLYKLIAISLSVINNIGGYRWPNSIRAYLKRIQYLVVIKMAANSSSEIEEITTLHNWQNTCIAVFCD